MNGKLLPADTYIVVNKTILSEQDKKKITMLYQPIIGHTAVSLYLTLIDDLEKREVMSDELTHHHLVSTMQLKLNDIVIAREKLEAVGLLKTYVKEENVNKEALMEDIKSTFGIEEVKSINNEKPNVNEVITEVQDKIHEIYSKKEEEFGSEELRELERIVMLKIVDQRWMDHIDNMDELKNGIGLQGYGQKDPVVQYRILGGEMFDEMTANIKVDVVKFLLNARKKEGGVSKREETSKITNAGLEDTAINLVDGSYKKDEGGMNKTVVNNEPKVGRNDPCPCGSGKKYKNCCGKNQ